MNYSHLRLSTNFVLTGVLILSTLSIYQAASPRLSVNNVSSLSTTEASEMTTKSTFSQGDNPVTEDPSIIPKITVNPKLDEIDEKYSKCRGIEIREITIPQLQTHFATGQLTSLELVKCYLERLDMMNNVLRVVIQVNPDAIQNAMERDNERRAGNIRGPMHGIPILIKDGIGTQGDAMETTAGSPALLGLRPKKDAALVTALRKAGAVILGKSNLSELYSARGGPPNGWSGRGGQTRNPYNLNERPEGSSSGSAVAVSANLCAVSVGTETDGSTIAPSSVNGICGMKPTYGLISLKGVIPFARSQDHIGSMGRTITDVAILLDALIIPSQRPSHHPSSYFEHMLNSNISRPLRIGVMRYPYWSLDVTNSTSFPQQMPQLEYMLERIKTSQNFQLVDPVDQPSKNLFTAISVTKEIIVLLHDFKHGFNEFLKNHVVEYPTTRHPDSLLRTSRNINNKTVSCLKDVIQYNQDHPIPEGYPQDGFLSAQATDGIHNTTYIQARDTNRAAAQLFLDSVMEAYNLDVIVSPSYHRHDGVLDKDLMDFPPLSFSMACISGYPSITVPVGIGPMDNIPVGLTFIGRPYTEPILLKVAHAVEQLDPQRKLPRFLI